MTERAARAGVLREVVLALAAQPGWAEEVSEQVATAVAQELPALATDDVLQAAMRASNQEILRVLVRMLQEGVAPETAEPPEAAVAVARELVRRGVGIEVLLQGYQTAHAAFFADFLRRVHDDPRLAGDAPAAIEEAAQWLFAFVGRLTREISERYSEERERWVRSAAASRLRDVRLVLGDEPVDVDAMGRRLRYPLERTHLALVLWADVRAALESEPAQAVLERAAADLATALGATSKLVVGLEDEVVAAWLSGVDQAAAQRIPRVRPDPATVPRPSVAWGLAAAGLAGFRAGHEQAMQARRVARLTGRQPGTIVQYRDVALIAIATGDVAQAQEFVARELGQLAADTDEARRLAATLRVYLDEGSSARSAAKRLGVHENTIKNRLRAAEDLIGHPVAERIAELHVALRLTAVPAPGSPASVR